MVWREVLLCLRLDWAADAAESIQPGSAAGKQTVFVSDVWDVIARVWDQPGAANKGGSAGFHIPQLQVPWALHT